VNRTRKHAASVTAYSVLRACPSIQCSTPKLHQQTTGKFGNEKELKSDFVLVWSTIPGYCATWPPNECRKPVI